MSLRTGILLAALIFILTLVVRLPARLLVSYLPAEVSCEDPGGTVWEGSCGRVRMNGVTVAGLSWKLHPLALLRATLSADVSSSDPNNGGRASIEATRSGDLSVSELHAVLPFPPGSNVMPRGTSATLTLALAWARIHETHLVSIIGTIGLQQLHIADPPADLGSFELQFPATESSTMTGQLRDLEGPLAVNGQVVLQPSGTYEINGTTAPRAALSEDLSKALQFLGPPDANGQRTFSLAGSL
ncbi:MAG TPA: type II secretion system protein N [Steroidobacteraceae bacterium]|jgi:general secretion pathway protein N|nr:type II secretion system protein N [Steroidobacteraceae bacterium]